MLLLTAEKELPCSALYLWLKKPVASGLLCDNKVVACAVLKPACRTPEPMVCGASWCCSWTRPLLRAPEARRTPESNGKREGNDGPVAMVHVVLCIEAHTCTAWQWGSGRS